MRLIPANLRITWLGSDLCRRRANVGHPTTVVKSHSRSAQRAQHTGHWNPHTHSQPCAQTQQNCLQIAIFLMMNTRTPSCLKVLRPSAPSTNVSLVTGSASGMRREAGARHIVVLRARCACSCLLLAAWWFGLSSLTTGVGNPTGKKALTWDALTENLSDTCVYIHIQSCSQAKVSHSLFVSHVVFLGCGFRRTSRVEETLECRVSCTLAQVVRTSASSSTCTDRRRIFRIIRDPRTRVLQSHTRKFLRIRCASSYHVACTMVGLDLVDYEWTGGSDHSGKTSLTLNALTLSCI